MMQFLSPPERSVRDSAHAVNIHLAAHTEIPLKYKFGSCWRVLREFDASKFNISQKKKKKQVKEQSHEAGFIRRAASILLKLYNKSSAV